MIIAVHQPQYLPWLGYFDKMNKADVFCYLDNVQYKKNEWQNRNRIKTAQGWQWLTVPVRYRFPQKINEVEINNTVKWKKKQLQSLVSNYGRTPYFNEYINFFETLFSKEWEMLCELNIFALECLRELLGLVHKPAVKASSLQLRDDPSDRLIDICKAMKADTYLAGQDGLNYMDLDRFEQNGIAVISQEFNHPIYPQLFNEFESHMSVVDLLFNCGPDSMDIIRTGCLV